MRVCLSACLVHCVLSSRFQNASRISALLQAAHIICFSRMCCLVDLEIAFYAATTIVCCFVSFGMHVNACVRVFIFLCVWVSLFVCLRCLLLMFCACNTHTHTSLTVIQHFVYFPHCGYAVRYIFHRYQWIFFEFSSNVRQTAFSAPPFGSFLEPSYEIILTVNVIFAHLNIAISVIKCTKCTENSVLFYLLKMQFNRANFDRICTLIHGIRVHLLLWQIFMHPK